MDEIDKKILNLIQDEFPLHKRPYGEIGKQVGINEKEAMERVQRLQRCWHHQAYRRCLRAKKLDYTSTLCGVHVEEDKLMQVVDAINKHTGVTTTMNGKVILTFGSPLLPIKQRK